MGDAQGVRGFFFFESLVGCWALERVLNAVVAHGEPLGWVRVSQVGPLYVCWSVSSGRAEFKISLSMFGYVWSNIRDLVMLYNLSLRWLQTHNRDSLELRFSEMGL